MEREKGSKRGLQTRREFLKISGLSVGTLAWGSAINLPAVFAKEIYPRDKIMFVVPYDVGGGYDIYARAISPYLSKYLKETLPGGKGGDVMVRNEPAAAGRKGRSLIFNAKPDGYTIGIMDTSTVTDNIIGEADIDVTKFTFLYLAVSTNKVVATSKKGFNNWDEAVSAMKKRTVRMAVGSYGRANHISAIIMNEKMGTRIKLINFQGTTENVNALMRGDVDLLISPEESIKGLIDAKELRPLLIFDEASEYPGSVSSKQLGFPELADQVSSHRFVVAPPRLETEPKGVLLAALKKATADAEFIAWANKYNVRLKNIYGNDAEKMFTKLANFYEGIAPTLKKHLS